jgi:hypothetical protein
MPKATAVRHKKTLAQSLVKVTRKETASSGTSPIKLPAIKMEKAKGMDIATEMAIMEMAKDMAIKEMVVVTVRINSGAISN